MTCQPIHWPEYAWFCRCLNSQEKGSSCWPAKDALALPGWHNTRGGMGLEMPGGVAGCNCQGAWRGVIARAPFCWAAGSVSVGCNCQGGARGAISWAGNFTPVIAWVISD